MGALFCAMTCVFVLSAMVPSYLVDYLKLTPAQMGFVTSALGFGGFAGRMGLPGIPMFSDESRWPLKALPGAALMLWAFTFHVGPAPGALRRAVRISFFCSRSGKFANRSDLGESAPRGLVSSAIGIVVGSGEIFGGGVAPSVAGFIAQHYGIQGILVFGAGRRDAGSHRLCLGLIETAPQRVAAVISLT